MTVHPDRRRPMRILAVVLTVLWAAIAVAVASAYRPGGPIDIVIAMACFLPVLVADAGIVWPPVAKSHRGRVALVWIWIAAVLLAIPVLYGIAWTFANDGPQNLVPSAEAAYAGGLALGAMAFFSTVGLVHARYGREVFERRSTWLTAALTVLLGAAMGAAFVFVAAANDQALRGQEPTSSRFGPTDPDLEPPFCDEPLRLGRNAVITIEARSSVDNDDRGVAVLRGQRGGRDESWGGSWTGLDGEGRQAYLRLGQLAWLNDGSDDPGAPGSTWRVVAPDPFGMLGTTQLTTDGPPHAIANVPRGSIVAEDLGLEIIEGARARHCRTFMDGPTALDTFLPLRWLLADGSAVPDRALSRWRGEMDWWVFGDGELGMASVEISGSRGQTDWDPDGVRAVLEARLEAVERDTRLDISAPFATTATVRLAPSPSAAADSAIGSVAP
jgi:hypothetical protein